MIEVTLTEKQIELLFPALKTAETAYTTEGKFKACQELTKLYDTLHTQVYTYGQMEN